MEGQVATGVLSLISLNRGCQTQTKYFHDFEPLISFCFIRGVTKNLPLVPQIVALEIFLVWDALYVLMGDVFCQCFSFVMNLLIIYNALCRKYQAAMGYAQY